MIPIRLSVKIILIFSAMMLIALMVLTSFAVDISVQGSNAFTASRFRNMSTSIARDLKEEYAMMDMTLHELMNNKTFMSALNQIVRDDSEDQKMAKAGELRALEQLTESPLVDTYYRVSFFNRNGVFITSGLNKDSMLTSRTPQMISAIASLSWLADADRDKGCVILPATRDYFSNYANSEIYGIARQVSYGGIPIGYISVVNRSQDLAWIMNYLDEPDICVEAVFGNGNLLYRNRETGWNWPSDLTAEQASTVKTVEDGSSRIVYYTQLEDLGLNLYISQDSAVAESGKVALTSSLFRRTLLILIPSVFLITVVAVGLTGSIRKLTKKVRHISAASVFAQEDEKARELLAPVTSAHDYEIHSLEAVFDRLMLRLRESTANEITLREGTLQAQLNALQTQINPHFIYNTLNIISAKSMETGNLAVIEICGQFADMLRYSTDTRSRTATMAEEIENVRNYLNLAKARYEDNLEFTIDVPENLNTITVPKLTLQPLVENAMTHGFNGLNVQRRLSVTGEVRGNSLVLEIRDNGTGFSDEMLENLRARIKEIEAGKVSIEESGGHIGLVNTCLRLYYYSNGKMHVSIRNENGAVITLDIPFNESDKEKLPT